MEFILASHNPKKLAEMRDILAQLEIAVAGLPAGAPEPAEDGDSFAANALIKARAACALTGLPSLADDSGLCVDALDGAPGIYSARYGWVPEAESGLGVPFQPLPPEADDRQRLQRLLRNMEAVADDARQARFVCAIACVFPSGEECTVHGECAGEITRQPHGAGGFGYDPVFYVPEHGCTFGELPQQIKNRISHRAKALLCLRGALQERLLRWKTTI